MNRQIMKHRIIYTLILLLATVQTFAQGTTKYEYDKNNRLTKVVYSNGVEVKYTYDKLGNRVTKKVSSGIEETKGDANGDGTVNAADIVEVVNYIMGSPSEKFKEDGADASGDGTINAADIVTIVNIIMGL